MTDIQFVMMILSMLTILLLTRSEAAKDRDNANQKMEAHRLEAQQATATHRAEVQNILTAIQNEMKDFHGRLCEIQANKWRKRR